MFSMAELEVRFVALIVATPVNTAPGVEFGKNQYWLLLNGKFVF